MINYLYYYYNMKLPITMSIIDCGHFLEVLFSKNKMISTNIIVHHDNWKSHRDTRTTIPCIGDFRLREDERSAAYFVEPETITITSIEPTIPEYNIGDCVLILASGEIGYVHDLSFTGNHFFIGEKPVKTKHTVQYHWSEIALWANDYNTI